MGRFADLMSLQVIQSRLSERKHYLRRLVGWLNISSRHMFFGVVLVLR